MEPASTPPLLPTLPPSLPPWPVVTSDDRTLAMLCHLLAIFTGFLGPLVLWLVKKDASPFVDHHGREALNFQLTVLLASICLAALTFVLLLAFFIGILLVPVLMALSIGALVLEIMAALAAQRGEWYHYPWCIRFV